ncbi:hypothetical protein ASPWEDRAFT_166871 [Aspergillus wentii DTO 134E9]|uniref:Uncharacterized protein n=1 Tax=Aspergillus wentii DTO 134E9 TaxID=1073089 RepID=A0A1L9S0X0_ASPWE|nr:uncharacterized protein ASPWEDRAFT_166871 [Aspergillus wentii DTO 134E9]KAI9931181.1 hypothetical protein MW887_010840 [Aspergillus wentii]OJJ40812.1 hypothetical protein ASPWEDRAFT_166871 [Aspergillus wentii DTO 134E9]
MVELTVAHVSGIIAAVVFIARLWSPNTITLIIAGIVGDHNSASTWTVSGRVFQQSLWPDLLQTDSARSYGARGDVTNLSRLITGMALLISIAGIVTPLGLYEAVVPGPRTQASFQYMPDASPFGYGTPPRSSLPFSRICQSSIYTACPFSDTVMEMTEQDGRVKAQYPYKYNTSIPSVVSDIYSSGTDSHTTVSNFFDIQWRRYATQTSPNGFFNNGSSYLVGDFRPLQSILLNNAIEPVEGLIVDSVNGGIGFRNHTVPPGFPLGVEWTEDLLFIEPETECVDTNLTIDFSISLSQNSSVFVDNVVLTDRGGFANLNHTFWTPDQGDPQANAHLRDRAYTAAMVSNSYTMFFYNVSNPAHQPEKGMEAFAYVDSHIGKTFPVQPLTGSSVSSAYDALSIDMTFENYFDSILNNSYDIPGIPKSTASNPFKIDPTWWGDISDMCQKYLGDADTNINNILISCGYMYGAPQRRDGGSPTVFDSGSQWSKPLHVCATATKAVIKTATLNYNGTKGLKSLTVSDLHDKIYSSPAEWPLWGVEDVGNISTSIGSAPVWGLISADNQAHPNVSAVRQESLYLTGRHGALDSVFMAQQTDNLPAAEFLNLAMSGAYGVGYFPSTGASESSPLVDYSGSTQMAMWARWQSLSESALSASKIINLIWTDFAASAVVGRKGVLGPGNTATTNTIAVVPFERRVQYNLPYAIPAIITGVFLLAISVAAVVICVIARVSIALIRKQMNRASSGRILTTFMYPGESEMDTASKDWSNKMGKTMIALPEEAVATTELSHNVKTPDPHPVEDPYAEESELLATPQKIGP